MKNHVLNIAPGKVVSYRGKPSAFAVEKLYPEERVK